MRKSGKLSRRKFIRMAAAAAAASGAVACNGTRSPWRFFSAQEAMTLAAICDQIIPPDQDPGARQAGVVNYIDRQLTGYFKRFQRTYRRGIAGLDETSLALHGKRFVDLSPKQQTSVLEALEKDQAPGDTWRHLSARRFFSLVVAHTMQGFYGDPRHGGNRDGVSWKMVGLPYPPIRGRLLYDLTKPPNGKPA
jgi:gluconate 2-dehydrogenase gamma chain